MSAVIIELFDYKSDDYQEKITKKLATLSDDISIILDECKDTSSAKTLKKFSDQLNIIKTTQYNETQWNIQYYPRIWAKSNRIGASDLTLDTDLQCEKQIFGKKNEKSVEGTGDTQKTITREVAYNGNILSAHEHIISYLKKIPKPSRFSLNKNKRNARKAIDNCIKEIEQITQVESVFFRQDLMRRTAEQLELDLAELEKQNNIGSDSKIAEFRDKIAEATLTTTDCDLLLMSESQIPTEEEEFAKLPAGSRFAYVLTENCVYFIDKANHNCFKFPKIESVSIKYQLKLEYDSPTDKQDPVILFEKLSSIQLEKITEKTKYDCTNGNLIFRTADDVRRFTQKTDTISTELLNYIKEKRDSLKSKSTLQNNPNVPNAQETKKKDLLNNITARTQQWNIIAKRFTDPFHDKPLELSAEEQNHSDRKRAMKIIAAILAAGAFAAAFFCPPLALGLGIGATLTGSYAYYDDIRKFVQEVRNGRSPNKSDVFPYLVTIPLAGGFIVGGKIAPLATAIKSAAVFLGKKIIHALPSLDTVYNFFENKLHYLSGLSNLSAIQQEALIDPIVIALATQVGNKTTEKLQEQKQEKQTPEPPKPARLFMFEQTDKGKGEFLIARANVFLRSWSRISGKNDEQAKLDFAKNKIHEVKRFLENIKNWVEKNPDKRDEEIFKKLHKIEASLKLIEKKAEPVISVASRSSNSDHSSYTP